MIVVALLLATAASLGSERIWRTTGTWQQSQGLPQNSVRALLQTRDGYLWLGTTGGAARFDGVRFTVFEEGRGGLGDNEVWALAEAEDASVWIGTYGGGVSRWAGGRLTTLTTKDGLVNDYVAALSPDREGGMWIGTDEGLSRYKNGRFESYTASDGLADRKVRSLYVDQDGSLWIGGTNAVTHLTSGKLHAERLPGAVYEARSFCRDDEQSLWVGTYNGLWRQKGGVWTRFTTRQGLASDVIHQVQAHPAGGIWIATDNGLDHLHRGFVSHHPIDPDSLRPEHLAAVLVDREGGVWAASWSHGLAHLRPSRFVTYTARDGLPSDYVSSVLQDGRGDIWIGTNRGLALFRNGGVHRPTISPATPLNVVSLALEREGTLLVGTTNGVYRARRAGELAVRLSPVAVGPEFYARVVYPDRSGILWIGTDKAGLVRYARGRLTTFTTADGLPNDAVRAVMEDAKGALWVGTKRGGLARFQDGHFTVFGVKDGLADTGVYGIHVSADGALWIATRHGLSRLKDGAFRTITVNQGLYSHFAYALIEDPDGELWMSCSKGIFRVSERELNEVADGRRASLSSNVYGIEHGLSGIVATVGHRPGAWRASDGGIWFATADGVAVAFPQRMSPGAPPPIRIERIVVDQKEVNAARAAALPPGHGELAFEYTSLSFVAPEKLRFRYRLQGFQTDWVEAGTRRVAYYTNVPPGSYRFEVTARGSDGPWNEVPASVEISLASHFYQTAWFGATVAASLVALGLGLHLVRVRRLARQQARLQTLVEERTRELTEATRRLDLANQDLERRVALGIEKLRESERMAAYGQMVAAVAHEVRHPVFALRAAAHVVNERLGSGSDVAPQLRTLATETERLNVLMSDLLEFARPSALHRASATAADLLAEAREVFAEEEEARVPVVVEVEPGLPRLCVDRVRLVQILLNLMRNAITHAAGLSRITLRARARPVKGRPGVRLIVADDGCGIRPDLLARIFEPFVTSGRGTGLGLSIVRRVVEAHGGEIGVEPEPGGGTAFQIDLEPAVSD